MRKLTRGTISAPLVVLMVAIIVIAVVLVGMGWASPMAKNMSKSAIVEITGQPAITVSYDAGTNQTTITVYATLKNLGVNDVTVNKLVVKDDTGKAYELTPDTTVLPGESEISVTFTTTVSGDVTANFGKNAYDISVITTGGTVIGTAIKI